LKANTQTATDVEGIFRLSGSAKRIKDLQTVFNSPERYGKGLDWAGYTVHDAANILRRYLNQLPEPIVPLEFYERFRDPLRPHATRTVGDGEAQPIDMSVQQHGEAVTSYQKLITELPPLNRQLLLYILDLLAVFASKSDLNRMNAANLAAIFQPGILSHPQHDMAPVEYRLSQDVLIFLIENQDNFLIGMTGTAVDEKTVKDVEAGAAAARSPKPTSIVGRSTSNASAGADSLRKFGVRRNVSVSSGHSRERGSPGVSSPGTPTGLTQLNTTGSGSGGLGRSNTVPSKRSPALAGSRFQRMQEASPSPTLASTPTQATVGEPSPISSQREPFAQPMRSPTIATGPQPRLSPALGPSQVPPAQRERKISNLFAKSPIFGPSEAQVRQPKKLQKRSRIPGTNDSAQSSQASLHGDETPAFHTPMVSPAAATSNRPDPIATKAQPEILNTTATPVDTPTATNPQPGSAEKAHLVPPRSPAASLHSGTSVTDHSEFDALDNSGHLAGVANSPPEKERKRHRWRFSSSAKRSEDFPLSPPPPIGGNAGARGSNSSFGSSRPRKSFTGDSSVTGATSAEQDGNGAGGQSFVGPSVHSRESGELLRDVTNVNSNASSEEKKGLFGKWKAKMSERSEQKKLEKERAKSPPAPGMGQSRTSLSSAVGGTQQGPRGRSFEVTRGSHSSAEGGLTTSGAGEVERAGSTALETLEERPVTEAREKENMSGASQVPPVPAISDKQPAGASTTASQAPPSEPQAQSHPVLVPSAPPESKDVTGPSTTEEPKQTVPATSSAERTGPSPS
jgi:GTPase-activating protein SAC7